MGGFSLKCTLVACVVDYAALVISQCMVYTNKVLCLLVKQVYCNKLVVTVSANCV